MLDFFRQKGLTSVVYGAIIVATVLVFILGFNPSAGKKLGSVSEACAARIHGSCIEPKAHRAAFRLIFSRGTGGMRQAVASRIVLEGLIERELLAEEAERLGLTVSDDEITDSIFKGNVLASLPAEDLQLQQSLGFVDGRAKIGFKDPKTKQFDMKTYERTVKMMTGRSPAEFRQWQGRELLAAKMRDLVRAPVRVADDEALDRFKTERTTASVGYAVVRRSWLEKYGIVAKPADVDAWAKDKTNLAQVKVPVRHILIKPAGDKPEDKEAAKKKAQDLLDRIKKGEDFAKLAKENSDDPGSKDKGGMYPGEMVEQFVEPFKKAVEGLKPGELDQELVETQFGWHIIKRDPATRDDLVKAYKAAKSLELAKSMANDIIADVKAGKPGDEAVKAAIAKYGITKPEPKKPEPAKTAAADGGAKAGDAGAKAAAADAGAPQTPEYTAETAPDRPQWLASSAFNRGGDPIPAISGSASQAVIDFAFDKGKPGEVDPEPIRTDDGYLVIALKDRKPATEADFEKERAPYMQTLLVAKQNEALANYVRRLREASKADVKIDENNVFGAKTDAGAPEDQEEDEGP